MSGAADLDIDVPVTERLLLVSLPGALDYLAADLAALGASVVRRLPDALLVDWAGPLRPLAAVRFYSVAAVWMGDDLSVPERPTGLLAGLEGPTFRVAPDLGDARWPLRDHLVSAWGWRNEPGDWQLNLREYDGMLVAEVGALHQTARFGRLERIPASTTPVVSAVLARLLKPEPGHLVLDPFCGAGTNLLTAAAARPDLTLLGSDTQSAALVAARVNLPAAVLLRADAARLPLADGAVDRVVANLPFGKRVGSHGRNVDLYPAFLRQLTRVLTDKGRAVLLTDDKRILVDAVQRTANLRIIKEVQLSTGGLHPSAYVVVRGRSRGASRAR